MILIRVLMGSSEFKTQLRMLNCSKKSCTSQQTNHARNEKPGLATFNRYDRSMSATKIRHGPLINCSLKMRYETSHLSSSPHLWSVSACPRPNNLKATYLT